MAFIVPAAFTSQGSSEATSIQYTTTTPDPSLPLPVKYFEVDRHYNYHIPSDDEIAATKNKLMKKENLRRRQSK